MDIGTLIARSAAKAQRERLASPAIVQRGRAIRAVSPGGGGELTILRIVSEATGNGTYSCYAQEIDATDWNLATPEDKLDDDGTAAVVVFNLAENGLSGHALSAGDLLVGWQMEDDEANDRWVGVPATYAWWHS